MIGHARLPGYKEVRLLPRQGDILVMIPVYNEMPHLPEVLQTIKDCWSGDILAIDDASADTSLHCLKQVESINILHNRRNAGAGGVLLQGFRWADRQGYKSVITLDADGQHSPFLIKDFMAAISPICGRQCRCEKHKDFVWGSRYMAGHQRLSRAFQARQEVNKLVTARLNTLTGYHLTDAFCGFRAYRLSALRKLALTETGYGMFLQMTIQAAQAGIRIRELPVPLVYLDETRDFNSQFQDTRKRLDYYMKVIDEASKKDPAS